MSTDLAGRRNDNLLSKLTFGLSYQGQGYRRWRKGKSTAARFCLSSAIFLSAVAGRINQYPVSPEKFDIESTDQTEYGESIGLAWSESVDPDLYDDVRHLLLGEPERRTSAYSPIL